MASTLAHTEPEVMRWARESIGYSLAEAAELIDVRLWKLQAVEEGVEYLTLREAERAANAYERPMAALFLPKPPAEEPHDAQFRRLPGSPPPPWPPAMRLLARRIRERQDAASELYELLEDEPLWQSARASLVVEEPARVTARDGVSAAARQVRVILGVAVEEQMTWLDASGYRPLRAWVDAVEALGVLVMQDGSLAVEEMRGFAALHEDVPILVANTNDDPRARAFSVIHELGHLILAANGQEPGPHDEPWCNEFAGQVLMPEAWFTRAFHAASSPDPLTQIDRVALRFGVTPLAAAVRVARYALLPRGDADALVAAVEARWRERTEEGEEEPTRRGGNYYWNEIARLGPGFIRLVFSALESQAVTYPAASGLLGVKVSNFERLRDHLSRRR